MADDHTAGLATDLARRLKAARALTGLKVKDVALSFGWSEEKLYRMERGSQVPDALELAALASHYEQSILYFYNTSNWGSGTVALSVADVKQDNDKAVA